MDRLPNFKIWVIADHTGLLGWDAGKKRGSLLDTHQGKRESICGTTLTWTPEGRRMRGLPKDTWRGTSEKDGTERDGRPRPQCSI